MYSRPEFRHLAGFDGLSKHSFAAVLCDGSVVSWGRGSDAVILGQKKMKAIVSRSYINIGIMEKKMETTIVYWGVFQEQRGMHGNVKSKVITHLVLSTLIYFSAALGHR